MMIMRRRTPVIGAVAIALACAAQSVVAQPAPDRSVRPTVGEAPDLRLPALQQFSLDNGMRVLLMEKRDLPLVQVNFIIDAGSVLDAPARPGIASLTAAMIDEGAAGRSALEIADAFEMLGARFSVGAGTHNASVSLRAPTQQLTEALRVAGDVLLRPDFPTAELDRIRLERLTALLRRYDEPNSISSELFDLTLYGREHPYGRSASGTEDVLRNVTVDELRAFHAAQYRPNSTTVIVVGDITADRARALLGDVFGGWKAGEPASASVAAAPQVKGRTIYIVDKPGAAQSVIRFGRIGVPRNTDDYFALEVMNTILGGSFTSRLNQNLRETHGYAYGASSGFSYMPAPGPWMATSSVQTQSTGPALGEFMKELRRMHEPVPEEEVARARNFLAMRYPAGFQSVAGIAGRLSELVQYDLPGDYFNSYVDRVLEVTKADVERVARQYIDVDNVAIMIVGDRSVIEPQVRAQNLGEIRFLEVTDVLGPMPVLND